VPLPFENAGATWPEAKVVLHFHPHRTPAVFPDRLKGALSLYPAGKTAPTLPADLDRYVLPAFAGAKAP
jgi:hypothetical protein